jgi:uncharacterized protein Yka (UPF0111/DUF47 family)
MAASNLFDRIFPVRYDFFKMLDAQAKTNEQGLQALCSWLNCGQDKENERERLSGFVLEADTIRKKLEEDLVKAFSTPFDRGDIYSVSVSMHKVLDYARSTLQAVESFGVTPDDVILEMTDRLAEGMGAFAAAVEMLKKDPKKAEQSIPAIRNANIAVQQLYRDGMSVVFQAGDPMNALRLREVYHHIKDASTNLDEAADVLHRIIVRLS